MTMFEVATAYLRATQDAEPTPNVDRPRGQAYAWELPARDDKRWMAKETMSAWTAVAPCCGEDATWSARMFRTAFGHARIDYSINCPCWRAERAAALDATRQAKEPSAA